MTLDQLRDELARELYSAVVRPVRFGWDDLPPLVQESWRAGADAAIGWLARRTTGDQDPAAVELAELL